MKQKFMELNINADQKQVFNDIKKWFSNAANALQEDKLTTQVEQLENQIKQFMQPHIRLLPSRHDFIAEKSDTLLESALRSGLAVDYGCNNGKCGKCKAKLLSGAGRKTRQQDYVFSESEKSQGYILTCSNTATTDITLETEEAISVDDIPLQTIAAKVKKIERSSEHVIILTIKTPRSQRLRFLAGQHIELHLDNHLLDDGQPVNAEYSIASCPCEPSNLEFHIPIKDNTPPPEILNKPGQLTDEEFVIMRDHVVDSHKILAKTPGISQNALDVAALHHEKYDGSGYPDGTKGDEISLIGQMSAIVDVYDALTADRCYHNGHDPSITPYVNNKYVLFVIIIVLMIFYYFCIFVVKVYHKNTLVPS